MAVREEVLGRLDYFTGLSQEELRAVKKFITLDTTLAKGEMLLLEDEKSDYLYFVASGVVKVYKRSVGGKEQVLNMAARGESINDVSTFDGGSNAANMVAVTPVRLYGIKKSDTTALICEHPRVALNAVRVLAGRVRRDSSLVEELSFDQVMNRLAKWLLKHVREGAGALPRFTQQDLATMVGTSRVVVNRTLRVMEETGAIRLERRRIVVHDEAALRELVTASHQLLAQHKKFGQED